VDRNGDLHVIWSENGRVGNAGDIMYRKREKGVWLPEQNITSNPTAIAYGSVEPDIAIARNGDTVHVVWHDDFVGKDPKTGERQFHAYYTKNTKLGDNDAWLPAKEWKQLSTGIYGKHPTVFLDTKNRPHVIWIDRMGAKENLQAYSRWTGKRWTKPVKWGAQGLLDAAFDNGGILRFAYRAADTKDGKRKLYYGSFDPKKGLFSEQQLVSAGVASPDRGSIALDPSGRPYVVWKERHGEWPGVGSMLFSRGE